MRRAGMKGDNSGEVSQEYLLEHIAEFTEWGGHSWAQLTRYALGSLRSLRNKRVLEIGFRSGKMSSLFALMGANVTALDVNAAVIPEAEKTAAHWGVGPRVSFAHYDGKLSHCSAVHNKQFDLIFSKSVLVLLGELLPSYLRDLDDLLAFGGQCVFL